MWTHRFHVNRVRRVAIPTFGPPPARCVGTNDDDGDPSAECVDCLVGRHASAVAYGAKAVSRVQLASTTTTRLQESMLLILGTGNSLHRLPGRPDPTC